MFRRRTAKPVFGERTPLDRDDAPARFWLALYIGAPALIALALLDFFVWAAVKAAFGVCVGLWCVF